MASTSDSTLQGLNDLAVTATTLLHELETALDAIARDKDEDAKFPRQNSVSIRSINPASLVHSTSSLIRAHSTKLSLLIINEPFTPSAISTVLRTLISGPIPAVTGAVQACDARRYTRDFRRALASHCATILKELRDLVGKIPRDGKALPKEQQDGSGKGSLAVTGLVWQACDKAIAFADGGPPAFFIGKVEETKDMLKDAMEELKEWGEETEEDDQEDDFDVEDAADFDSGIDVNESRTNSPESSHASIQAMLDSLVNSHKTIPPNDPEGIRPRLDVAIRRLRLCALLCQAIVRRRLKTLPGIPTDDEAVPKKIETVLLALKGLPEKSEDVAGAFYDLDVQAIEAALSSFAEQAVAASGVLAETWERGRDEYSEWADKFAMEINK
jgi:hypothetical protein